MKNILIISALMVTTAMSAQSLEQKTLSPKELKAKQKTELAEFKAQQAAQLAQFIERQKQELQGEKPAATVSIPAVAAPATASQITVEAPVLTNQADTMAYLFGALQSKGLKEYLANQLKVDSTCMADFYRGLYERTGENMDPTQNAYFSGVNIGETVERMAADIQKNYYVADPNKKINKSIIAKSIAAALEGQNPYTPEDAQKLYQTKMEQRNKENNERIYGPNREAGEKFLAENKKKKDVVTLPSGVQYKVIKLGDGPKPKATDRVKVNYAGRLIDGTEFDSSYKRNQPSEFKLNQVIKGWTEAMQLMPVGSTYEIYIPYDMAYGERNSGKIQPYSALIFTVELLDIVELPKVSTTPRTSTSTKK